MGVPHVEIWKRLSRSVLSSSGFIMTKRKSYSIVVLHSSSTRAAIYLSGAVEHLHFRLIGCSLRASGEGLVTIESYQACAYQISTSLWVVAA